MKKPVRFVQNWPAAMADSLARFAGGSGSRGAVGVADVIFVSLELIRFKLLGRTIRALRSDDTPSDDWDLDRRPIEETAKYISVVQHFRDGVPWEATPIFRRYARRFAEGEVIRGCRSVDELKDVYRDDLMRLYNSLKTRGFLSNEERGSRKNDLPHVYVGRDGEIIFGSDGNHRLAIACVLGFGEIPCRVVRRHVGWENLRQDLAAVELKVRWKSVRPALKAHPDLRDLLP